MSSQRIFEGTGEEIAQYAQEHPQDRFKLILLNDAAQPERGPGSVGWEEMLRYRHSLKGKMAILPLEATSTESLYD